MHRQPLLHALAGYAERHPDEAQTVMRFRSFVEAHERCFERTLAAPGHVTGSAWILDPDHVRVLLTHHRKLDLWLQLGGHADGDPDVLGVARREGLEESGLASLDLLDPYTAGSADHPLPIPFDLDIHEIPARRDEPAHLHFDVRFAFAARDHSISASSESHALAWVPLARLEDYTPDESVLRMAAKWRRAALSTAARM